MSAVDAVCDFAGCVLNEDHLNGFTDLHVRDVKHGPVTIAYSIEGDVKSAAWIPGISEFTFDLEAIETDLAELDDLIAGLTAARTRIAEWVKP